MKKYKIHCTFKSFFKCRQEIAAFVSHCIISPGASELKNTGCSISESFRIVNYNTFLDLYALAGSVIYMLTALSNDYFIMMPITSLKNLSRIMPQRHVTTTSVTMALR